ncbi:MAG: CARDB domain-containing protein, partial [Candidatus Bathyarchaeia archaeon]
TVLDLYDTKIIGYGGIEVSHTTKDGYFKNLARDISIVSVEVSSDVVKAGDPVSVTVIVKNKGNVPENFDITVYWNDYNFGTLSVSDLNPGAEK